MTTPLLGAALKRNSGILIGYQGWVIGLGLALLGAGEFSLLLEFLLPSCLVSLALALSAVLTLEFMTGARPEDQILRKQVLWGLLCAHMAVMLLIISEWVMPEVLKSEGFRDVMHKTYSLTTVPVWVPVVLLAVGCLLFAKALRRLLTDTPEEGPST